MDLHRWSIIFLANSSPNRPNHERLMKLYLICDKDGTIASIHTGGVSGPQAAISKAGVSPLPKQTLHVIEATEELRSLSLSEIHRQFTVHLDKDKVTLVRQRGRKRHAKA